MGILGRGEVPEASVPPARRAYTRRRQPRADTAEKKKLPEKPKPWGMRERSLVAVLLVGSTITALVLALSARSGKLPGLPRLSSPDFSFSDTVIVENKDYMPTPEPSQLNAQNETIKAWTSLTQNLSGVYGFMIVRLSDSSTYGVHQREPYTAASLIKLPVLAALYQDSEQGLIDLETKYTLKDSDKVGGSGGLQYKAAGTIYTYRELAEAMGQQSDNTAYNVVTKKLGEARINKAITDFGMYATDYEQNITTPEDVAMFFKKLWQAKLLSLDSRDEILEYLTKTIYEAHLAAGIPDVVPVAHKYGREIHVVNDAGIVRTANPFIIVIMSKGVVEREADLVFPNLARTLFEGETGGI